MIKKPVVVEIQLNESPDKVVVFSGRRENTGWDSEKRPFQYSLTIMYKKSGRDPKKIVNLVILDDEVEMLSSPGNLKFIDDLNYKVLMSGYKFTFLRHYARDQQRSDKLDDYQDLGNNTGAHTMELMKQLIIFSATEGAFAEGIRLAVQNPFEGHLFSEVPFEHDMIVRGL